MILNREFTKNINFLYLHEKLLKKHLIIYNRQNLAISFSNAVFKCKFIKIHSRSLHDYCNNNLRLSKKRSILHNTIFSEINNAYITGLD